MRFLIYAVLALSLSCGLSVQAHAQTPPTPKNEQQTITPVTYKLTFVVRELRAGKVTGSRTYSSLFAAFPGARPGSIRAGDRVPVPQAGGFRPLYKDVGADFDFSVPDRRPRVLVGPEEVYLFVDADISGLGESVNPDKFPQPVIRQDKWGSAFILTVGKRKLLFSSDDPTLDRTTQVELTVEKAH